MIIEGIVSRDPTQIDDRRIYLTKDLRIQNVDAIRLSAGIICEPLGACDHVLVLCRIWGKPVIQLDSALELFKDGDKVALDSTKNEAWQIDVFTENEELFDPNIVQSLNGNLQISVADHRDITRINNCPSLSQSARYFFIREELLWACSMKDPFDYLKQDDVAEFSKFIYQCLSAAIDVLLPSQSLNFRSLDWRSDEYSSENGRVASCSQLGFHGIRRGLADGGKLIIAELKALAMFQRPELDKIVFSLPFVTDESEVQAVVKLVNEYCPALKRLGVFIETPAAVFETRFILQSTNISLVCVGTKDLTQTILACDRSNREVRHLFSPKKRSVLYAINETLTCCLAHNTECSIFVTGEELAFFREQFPSCDLFSLCCGELLGRDSTCS